MGTLFGRLVLGLGRMVRARRPLAIGSLVLFAVPVALAQSPEVESRLSAAAPDLMDTTSLGHGPYSRMHTLLEKTIFKVDVLTLDVHVGEEDAQRIERLIGGHGYSAELADSVASVAIQSRDAWARIEFLREVSLDQFVDGVKQDLGRARNARVIRDSDYRTIAEGLPRWFAFLEERRIQKGDQILYRIRGDSLQTRFRSAAGEILLDQIDIGPERRLAVLGSYFVRGSSFRDGLIRSLFRGGS